MIGLKPGLAGLDLKFEWNILDKTSNKKKNFAAKFKTFTVRKQTVIELKSLIKNLSPKSDSNKEESDFKDYLTNTDYMSLSISIS